MALCASVMAGIYASPVMAAELYEYNNDSQWVTTKGDNGTKITELEGLESIISDSFATTPINGNSAFWVNKDGKLVAANRQFTVDTNGSVYISPNGVQREATVVLNADTGIVTATNFATEDYNLVDIGNKTQNINSWTTADTTAFDGSVIADSFGTTKVNGNRAFWVNKDGMMEAAYGKFAVDAEGVVTATNFKAGDYDLTTIGDKTQNMWADGSQTNFSHSVNVEGSFSSGNGAVNLKGNWGEEASIELRDAKDKTYTLTATQLGNINNMITGAGVLENVVSINGAAVEGTEFGGLKISDVTLENGGIWAEKLNGKLIEEYVTDEEISGDLENIGGIDRKDVTGEGKPGEGTTVIEGNLSVSDDKINMFGDTGLTFDKGNMNNVDVISVSGNIGFNGSNVHFSYGSDGKTTTLGGLALTVDQIATDVSAIKEKTDHITVDDKGNVTISADDGSSLTVGKDGTSTGQGGQVTTDGNHTVNGDLDVDGSGQIDKDLTVGGDLEVGGKIDASEVNVGNTHITKDNGIETDKITVSGQGGSAIINGGYVGGSNDVFIDANGNNIFDEGETSLSGVNGKVDKVASDLGDVSILDPEIAGDSNGDGQNDVVGAVNNEAEIRRNEIERVDGRINNLENRVGELEDRIDKVGAMAAAIANLRTMGYDPAAPTEVAVGIGQYRDETGAALGLFHYPNRDFMLSLSVSTSGDEVMGGIGATWKFGRKSPEKVAEIKKAQAEADARRAEEAKLAKAEEMKQAAKEAKIKAQQERHAKLAAERAAQAEAAK